MANELGTAVSDLVHLITERESFLQHHKHYVYIYQHYVCSIHYGYLCIICNIALEYRDDPPHSQQHSAE